MEQKKQTVLDAIQKSEGNIDFYGLKETTGMEAIELFSVVEALAKENRILMRLNHLDEGTYCYKSSGDVLYERFMDLLFAHHGKRRSVAFYASRLCIHSQILVLHRQEDERKNTDRVDKRNDRKGNRIHALSYPGFHQRNCLRIGILEPFELRQIL